MKKNIFFILLVSFFGILCGQITLFHDDLNVGNTNWVIVNGAATNKWFYGTGATGNNTGSLYVSSSPTGTLNPPHSYSITAGSRVHVYTDLPEIPANAINITLTFDTICGGESSYDYFRVYLHPITYTPVALTGVSGPYSSGNDETNVNLIGAIIYNSPGGETSSTEWRTKSIHIPATMAAGQVKRLLFTWRNDGSIGTQPPVALDNITITYTEATPEPPPAVVVSPTNNATNVLLPQNLVWARSSEGSLPTGYKIFFGEVNPPVNMVDLGFVTIWTPVPSLNWNSTYYWQVIPYNSFGDASNCPIWTFSTGNDPSITTFPYFENFDSTTIGQLPYGWVALIENSTSATIGVHNDWNAYSAPNDLRMYNGWSWGVEMMAITPLIQDINTKRVSFYARCDWSRTILLVGTMSDRTDTSTWHILAEIPLENEYSWDSAIFVSLVNATGDYLAFKHGGDDSYQYIYIDDVLIEDLPVGSDFYCNTSQLNYGYTSQFQPKEISITVANTGSQPLLIEHFLPNEITVDIPNDYTIAVGQTQIIVYTITPTQEGQYNDMIMISTNSDITPIHFIDIIAFVLPMGTMIVGDGEETGSHIPWDHSYPYSYTQTIYYPEELNISMGDIITGLGYQYDGNEYLTDYIKFYIGYTNRDYFDNGDEWIDINNLELVFDGEVTSINEQYSWSMVEFDNIFIYNPPPGEPNLVIAIYYYTGWSSGWWTNQYYTTYVPNYRSLGYCEWGEIDLENIHWYWGDMIDRIPNTMFLIGSPVDGPYIVVRPQSLDYGVVRLTSNIDKDILFRNIGTENLTFTIQVPLEITYPGNDTYTLSPQEEITIPFTLSPANIGLFNNVINVTSNATNIQALNIPITGYVLPENVVQVGNNMIEGFLPTLMSYQYTYSQTIYYPEELEYTSGVIAGLQYHYNGYDDITDSIIIYLGTTVNNNFVSTTDWIPVSQMVQVYDGNITTSSGTASPYSNWINIEFDTVFPFNGEENLVVAFYKYGQSNSWGDYFFNTDMNSWRTLNIYSNSIFNPENPPSGYSYWSIPNTRIVFGPPIEGPYIFSMPTQLDFGDVNQSIATSREIILSNLGNSTINVTAITLPAGITTTNTTPFSIAADSQIIINLTMLPSVLGNYVNNIIITSNAINHPSYTIPITAFVNPELTVIIGNGRINMGLPAYTSYWGFSYSQTIYFPEEMVRTGMITDIAFYWNGGSNGHLCNEWEFYLGETIRTNFTSSLSSFIPVNELELVFNGFLTLPNTPGWVNIELDLPFIYSGGMNLVLAANEKTTGYSSSNWFNGTQDPSSTSRALRVNRDGSVPYNPAQILSSGSAALVIHGFANIKLNFTSPIEAPFISITPREFDLGTINQNTPVTRTAIFRNSGSMPLHISSFIPQNPIGLVFDPTSPFSIPPGENIQVSITLTPYDGGNYNNIVTIHSNAHNNPVTTIEITAYVDPERQLLWLETFDPTIGPEWTISNSTHVNSWHVGTAPVGNDTNSIFISQNNGVSHTYNATGTNRVHFWRDVTFPSDIYSIRLQFDMMCLGESIYDFVRVYLFDTTHIPTAEAGWTTGTVTNEPYHNFTLGPSQGAPSHNLINGTTSSIIMTSSNSWTPVTLTIPDSNSGQTKRLVFTWRNDLSVADQPPAAIDNIKILYALTDDPNMPRPRNLVGDAGDRIVNLQWDAPNITTQFIQDEPILLAVKKNNNSNNVLNINRNLTGYKIYKNGHALALIGPNELSFIDVEVVNNIDYTYFVTAVYTIGESNPSNLIQVTPTGPTLHPPANLTFNIQSGNNVVLNWNYGEYMLDENYEAAYLTEGWQNIDLDSDGNFWEISRVSYKEGFQCIISRSTTEDNTPLTPNNWLITPVIAPTINTYLNYWVGALNPNLYSESYSLMVSTTGTSISDFTDSIISEVLHTGAWQRRSINLSNYQGQNIYIAFLHNTQTPQSAIKIDGVQVIKHVTNVPTGLQGFRVYRNEVQIFQIIGPTLSYIDNNAPLGTNLYYVTQFFGENQESASGNAWYVDIVSELDIQDIPYTTELKGNYPNPFNPETIIHFTLSKETNVSINIYNIKGQIVKTVIDEYRKPGEYKMIWEGQDNKGRKVSSGIYFYRMKTDEYTSVKRMILMK